MSNTPAQNKAVIEAALRELPLSEEEIASAIPALLGNIQFLERTSHGSLLFAFKEKAVALVSRFEKDGLTLEGYLRAAIKEPSLFYRSPDTMESNIRNLVSRFEKDGLTLQDYLSAAVRQPSLFCQSTDTIAGHIRLLAHMYRKEMITVKGGSMDDTAAQPLKPLFDFLITNPVALCLANENLFSRGIYPRITGTEPLQTTIMRPRSEIEAELCGALGHSDIRKPVPKIAKGENGYRENLVLRVLIRQKIIRGRLEESPQR